MSNITNWDVLHKLRPEFVSNMKVVCLLNQKAFGAIIITKDDEVFSLVNFGQQIGSQRTFEPMLPRNVIANQYQYNIITQYSDRMNQYLEPIKLNELSGKQIITASHGMNFIIALSSSGLCYSWGFNSYGQLGDNSTNDRHRPALIESLKEEFITDISCGDYHSIVLTKTGRVYGFGANDYLQLGLSPRRNQVNPILINGFNSEKIIAISCGSYHSIALTESGHVFSWGYNLSNIPELIEFDSEEKIIKISCGLNHSLLLTNNGVIYGFGCNKFSQLGNNQNFLLKNPLKIKTPVKFIEIASQFRSNISIAKSENGFCYIWGQSNSQIIRNPTQTPFTSIHDIFSVHSYRKYSYKPIVFYDKTKRNSILSQMVNAFNDKNSSDFLFKIEDKVIYTHKAILKIRCEHFRALFSEKWDPNDVKELVIDFCSYQVYYAFLKYLYTDLVDIEVKHIFDLYDLANYYSEKVLEIKCFEIIYNKISVDNVLNWYTNAVNKGLEELEDIYLKFIAINLNEICSSEQFKKFDSNLCKRLLINAAKLEALNDIKSFD